MKHIFYQTLAPIWILFTTAALANVTLRNGNFYVAYTDVAFNGQTHLKLERIYNSKSTFAGIFGLGWGTLFETSLHLSGNGEVEINEYGGGQNTHYKINDLRHEGERWVRTQADGRVDTFDESGHLLQSRFTDGRTLDVSYEEAFRIRSVLDSAGNTILFAYDDHGHVVEASNNRNNKKAIYRYSDDGLLVYSKDIAGNEYWYSYDGKGRGNLTEIDYSDSTKMTVEYMGIQDQENVARVTDRDGTITNYSYLHPAEKSGALLVKYILQHPDGKIDEHEQGYPPGTSRAHGHP